MVPHKKKKKKRDEHTEAPPVAPNSLSGVVDLRPAFQNRGVGSIILNRLLANAAAKGKPVELSVLKNNPARRLYDRLGFAVVSEDEMKYFMRRPHGV
jgi:GNAT superfamily N-acetyltransferase